MRYILNNEGYIYDVSFGAEIECDLGTCTEYTGEVPNDYKTIDEWFDKEIDRLNAWKIEDGNLVFDSAKEYELNKQHEKEFEDYKPLCKNDLYEINEKINQNDISTKEQHQTQTTSGKLIEINDAFALSPNIKINNINTSAYNRFKLITTNKNMLPNTAISKLVSGIKFTQNNDRSITLEGTSNENIEYDIAGTNNNISPVFAFKKGIDYSLSKCAVKQPVEGESLYFDNANGDNLKTLEIDGNSYQETTSGNQLVDFSNYDKISSEVTYSFENDIIICSNTSATYPYVRWDILDLIQNNTSKVLRFGHNGFVSNSGSGVPIQLITTYNDGTAIEYSALLRRDGTTYSYQIPSDVSNIASVSFDIRPNNFSTAQEGSIEITKPILYFDNNSEYEPYTNGVSPNPDYPQEIDVVEEYNLFDGNNALKSGAILTINNTNSITLVGQSGYARAVYTINDLEIGKTYTATCKYTNNSNNGISLRYVEGGSNKAQQSSTNTNGTFTITFTPTIFGELRFYQNTTATSNNNEVLFYDIQLTKGTTPLPYLPYNSIGVKIVGSNIAYENLKGYLNTSTNLFKVDNSSESFAFYISQPGKYIWNSDTSTDRTRLGYFGEMKPANNVAFVQETNFNKNKAYEFTKKGYYVIFVNSVLKEEIKDSFRINKGEEIQPYEQYQEQLTYIDLQDNFIGKIEDVKDRLYIKDGHAYLEKNIGKVVLNGSESWQQHTAQTLTNTLYFSSDVIDNMFKDKNYIVSNYFEKRSLWDNDVQGIELSSNARNLRLRINNSIASNSTQLVNWLSNNNVEVYYELATPETIDLGEVSISTFEGVNNISLLASMDTNMSCEYLEDLPLKMYNYDGVERNEIYNGVGGSIKFTDEDKPVTHICLDVRKGITINDVIFPQLELGTTNSAYEMHKGFELDIDFSDLANEEIDYFQITNDVIKVSIDNEETEFGRGYLSLLSGYNLIYGTQDVDLDITYYINELVVDDLGFLQGKSTTTNKFKILEDGSIEAHDGYFSGEVVITGGSIKDATIDGYVQNDTLNNYVQNDTLNNTLNNYVDNTTLDNTLNGYVENDTLNSYATKEALNTTNNNLATTNSNLATTNNNLKTTNNNLTATNTNLKNNYSSNTQLKTAGATIINGNNITTGSIKSNNYVSGTSGTKIDLSNGTIDSKNFKVKNDGSVDVTGDIYLGSGSKVVGGDGLLTNLHFQTIEKYSGYSLLGFAYNYGDTFDKLDVDLDVYIPTNFKVVEAYATLYHTPVDWAATNGYSQSAVVGYCRNVELYKCTDNKNFTMQASMGGGYYITTNELDGDLINEAFGTDGYTATNKTAPTIEVTRSSNIGASLTTGNNKLFLRTSQETTSYGNTDEGLLYSTDACSKTGLIKMVVDVIGYMNYE